MAGLTTHEYTPFAFDQLLGPCSLSQIRPCGLKSESEKKLPTLTTHKKTIWPLAFYQLLWPCDLSQIRQYGLESVSEKYWPSLTTYE
jgi:hypothetical protein